MKIRTGYLDNEEGVVASTAGRKETPQKEVESQRGGEGGDLCSAESQEGGWEARAGSGQLLLGFLILYVP